MPERPATPAEHRTAMASPFPPIDISPALDVLATGVAADIAALASACNLPASIAGSRWNELHRALAAHPAVEIEERPRMDQVRVYRLRARGTSGGIE